MNFSPTSWLTPAQARQLLLPGAVLLAAGAGVLTARMGMLIPGVLIGLPVAAFCLTVLFQVPRVGVVAFIVYCFLVMTINRHLKGAPFGLGMDGLLLLLWLALAYHRNRQVVHWPRLNNDLCKLGLIWFLINILEIGNPAGASILGWYYEMRGTTFYWALSTPLVFMLFYRPRDLNLFLMLVIFFSVAGAYYGIKQKIIGPDAAEQLWLDTGAAKTHVLFGVLRVFSFYSEAAQFGASQAHIAVVCLALATGPFRWWKRLIFGFVSASTLYGMLISGTRGAMFVLVAGIFMHLVLSKQLKVLVLGGLLAGGAFGILKYTTIGNNNPSVARMRTSLDPNDPSLLVRLRNQAKLREYLASRPLGGGVGVIGMWGEKYNGDKYLSTIAPDSYFVKIWAEYGIVGFLIWFGMMLYILGKSCGIVWRTRNPLLRQKLLALTAGYCGILMASYGNEVINQMPSAMIVYLGWGFVFLGPRLDTPLPEPAAESAPAAPPLALTA
ncbi:O-antigen ligase family protein [Hymenobacter canadensis]|uniref:O-antigen ligase domain-containing protein n=1 Tax=Hymenobacter canadensis TaxID=2999067 RepID=A0ABY7LTZ5_9BACT|nr:O-antigen ligase family protein [Hymenobacter canadensis]WBA43074.1 O-antigen ligase domain-containing protein [Hymenobacter canadensis]